MNPNINPDPPAPNSTTPSRGGPVTPAGRARSSRNSLRHGLTAQAVLPQAVVLETESQNEFDTLLDSFLTRFHPSDPVEQELVESMAAARWRLRRLYSIESRMFNLEMLLRTESFDEEFTETDGHDRLADAFKSLANGGPSLALLLRYETTLNRTYDRAFKQLTQLQSAPSPQPVPVASDGKLSSFRKAALPPAQPPAIRDPHPPEMPLQPPSPPAAPPPTNEKT